MKMKKIWNTSLFGIASAVVASVAVQEHVQAQDCLPPAKQPVALMLVADMANGDSVRYQTTSWMASNTSVQSELQGKGYNVLRLGTGYRKLPVDQNPVLDSALTVMQTNGQSDLVYINAHGTVIEGHHHILSEQTKSQINGETKVIQVYRNSMELLTRILRKSSANGQPVPTIFDSCAGDKLIQDVADVELPDGTQILTLSQSQDNTFSTIVGRTLQQSPFAANKTDLEYLYHSSNRTIFDDTDNPEKYVFAPSGAALTIVDAQGRKMVQCARKSITERIGIGFSDDEKARIMENYAAFSVVDGYMAQRQTDMITESILSADRILRGATSFEGMKRQEHVQVFQWATYLKESVPIADYIVFAKEEEARRAALVAARTVPVSSQPVFR